MGHIVPVTDESIRRAAGIIRNGGLVAFPTETVYGLGCNALDAKALARLFEAKQRPTFDPLIVHIETRTALDGVVQIIRPMDRRLMDRFWPGPLTLIFQKQAQVPDLVTAGLPTVAIRLPANPTAQSLIRASAVPIAAPSANPFGYVSPTTAQHVQDTLGEQVDLILDGGPCQLGLESTIISNEGEEGPQLLRAGSVPLADIEAVTGPVKRMTTRPEHTALAPGQLTRHYATRTPLILLPLPDAARRPPDGERAGLLAITPPPSRTGYAVVEVLSPSGQLREAAPHLFAALRRLDCLDLDRLYAVPCAEDGLGLAIMDRLRRCAVTAGDASCR